VQEDDMLLEGKTAVIYGGGGAIGGATARAFAREGARIFLAGRTRSKLDAVAKDIPGADVAVVDALDEKAVEKHADGVVTKAGRIDIALNAIGIVHVQGPPLAELSLSDFLHPLQSYARTNFITAKAVARHMTSRKSGVILTISTPGSRMAGVGFMGYGATCAAVEAFSRLLAAELGAAGVRVVCLRPDAIPEAVSVSHSRQVFQGFADRAGVSVEEMFKGDRSLLKRFPTLAEVADTAAFVASDRAGAITGAIVNLSCGSLVD
jgi:3-oxoacyl-[acyl-carrier protein] reductase